jgi:hypothetical protein
VQFDNAREFCGWGQSARYLPRVIRLCLSLRVTPIFIPQHRPQRNGAVENFNVIKVLTPRLASHCGDPRPDNHLASAGCFHPVCHRRESQT